MNLTGSQSVPKQESGDSGTTLFGTLEIEGEGTYYAFLVQKRTSNTWILLEQDVFDNSVAPKDRQSKIVAVIRSYVNGKLDGFGKTFLLTRLMTSISTMVYMCINTNKSEESAGFLSVSNEYYQESTGSYIKYEIGTGRRFYRLLEVVYEGFKLNITRYNRKLPVSLPKLYPVVDRVSKAAIVTNLGIRTAAALFKSMGSRLDWYKSMNYKLIDSNEKVRAMMSSFLDYVQNASKDNKCVLVGLDTETTGLNMLDLEKDNPLRDHVVAIPFAWKDNEAYVICTDMFYLNNVDADEVYPLFHLLFSRKPDFTFQDIELDYDGKHYSFNRKHIAVGGWNAIFDKMAFLCEGSDVFFDEDGRQIFFNLDTDLQQGQEGFKTWGSFTISNSLKMQTRRMLGVETLELEELFGKGNEDKFRYLQDSELVLLYGGADADFTRKMIKLGRQLTERALYLQYRKYDMTIMDRLGDAAWHGMPIDTESVKKLGDLVYEDIETLKNFIYHYAWLANRSTLHDKADKIQELLDLDNLGDIEDILDKEQMFRYEFTPANHKKLLFQILGYPVIKRTKSNGEPALDKFVLEKLMGPQRKDYVEVLTEDIMAKSDPSMKLVDKDMFNRDAFPLARVFSMYAMLNKEYTSYYKPIVANDTEGRMFYNFAMARAATRRILSPGQTMKKSLKKLVVAREGQIFMSFDASQIEYRHMASLAYIRTKNILMREHPDDWERRLSEAPIARIFNMMQKEEADYHTETAASMTGKRQHEVTAAERKRYKSIGFGIPYGLGETSMCESLHKGVVNEQTLRETRELLADYKVKQKEIIDLLESTRDSAFEPANLSSEYKDYLAVGDSHVGIVRNFVGFYRVFILENLTRARTGRIRRQAGNCIIQGGAAELFRRMLYNFHVGCCKYGIQDKIHWLMTVHDELDAIVDSDIDIMCLIKVLYENCTLRYEDHIPYYIGINFGANWYDAKADENELPVIMVQRMIDAYDKKKFFIPCDGRQSENLLVLKRHYMCDRVEEELKSIVPNLRSGHQWTDEEVALVDAEFSNYTVRAYMEVFSSKKASLREQLEGWQKVREEYGFGVSFLTEDLENKEIDLSSFDFDLSLDMFDDSQDGDHESKPDTIAWFGEDSLFDPNVNSDSILVDSEEYSYNLGVTSAKEEEYTLNENPTNAFDLFVSKRYVRTKVLKTSEDTYSVLTGGTIYQNREKELGKAVKKHFSSGTASILVIGSVMFKISNINCSDEDLDWLDKLVLSKEDK